MTFKNNIFQSNPLFNQGRKLYNEGNIYEAHIIWEKIWKHGDKESRKQIKGFIQLSGAIINNQYGKKHAVEYLLTKAIQNLLSLKESGININNLIDQINNYLALIHNDVCCSENIKIKI
tara:strand:+ start:320 stop:676 length:357 start_codon:yes stop_codon:yes gene_type:complete